MEVADVTDQNQQMPETGTAIPDTLGISQQGYCISFEEMSTIQMVRRVWLQLAMWTRSLIMSIITNHAVLATSDRLYRKVPQDFYNMLNTFYGPEISQQFLNLLSDFILSAWRTIEGINARNSQLVNTTTAQWYTNANDLAVFLARINIFWDAEHWRELLNIYIRSKIEEIIAAVGGQDEREIIIYDRIEDHCIVMANYMSRGIIASQIRARTLQTQPGAPI